MYQDWGYSYNILALKANFETTQLWNEVFAAGSATFGIVGLEVYIGSIISLYGQG